MSQRQCGKKAAKKTKQQRGVKPALDLAPFPPRKRTTFRYTDNRALVEAAVSGGAAYSYRLNSLYDPDYTGAGSQPMYFDQLVTATGPYTKYRVFSVRYRITFNGYSGNPVVAGGYPSPSPTVPTSLKQAMEKPWGQWRQLAPVSSGKSLMTFSAKHDIAQVYGLAKSHIANDEYFAGDATASPILGPYLVIWLYGGAGASTVAGASVTVEMLFDAEVYGFTNTATS